MHTKGESHHLDRDGDSDVSTYSAITHLLSKQTSSSETQQHEPSSISRSDTVMRLRMSSRGVVQPTRSLKKSKRCRSEMSRFKCDPSVVWTEKRVDENDYSDWDIPLPRNKRGRQVQLETNAQASFQLSLNIPNESLILNSTRRDNSECAIKTFIQNEDRSNDRFSSPSPTLTCGLKSNEMQSEVRPPVKAYDESVTHVTNSRFRIALPGAELHVVSSYVLVLSILSMDLLLTHMATLLSSYCTQQQFQDFFDGHPSHQHSFHSISGMARMDTQSSSSGTPIWPRRLSIWQFTSKMRSALTSILRTEFKPLLASSLPLFSTLAVHPTSSELRSTAILWISLIASAGSLSGARRLVRELSFTLLAAEKANTSDSSVDVARRIAPRENAILINGAFYAGTRSTGPEALFASNETVSVITLAELAMQRPLALRGSKMLLYILSCSINHLVIRQVK